MGVADLLASAEELHPAFLFALLKLGSRLVFQATRAPARRAVVLAADLTYEVIAVPFFSGSDAGCAE
jgi:hypothetical protein